MIHRDLKPANIMVEGDTLLIMDFGIARSAVHTMEGGSCVRSHDAVEERARDGSDDAGRDGGTVAYMSPEQSKGQPAEERSDICWVGVILRDMLVGLRHIEDPTIALNDLMEHVQHRAEISEGNQSGDSGSGGWSGDAVPAAGSRRTVSKGLGPARGPRPPDQEGKPRPKVRPLTKRLVYAVGTVVLMLLGGTWWLARSPAPTVVPDPVSVLIADFENTSGDPVFDGAVEQALSIAIEGASFITAYPRRDAATLAARIGAGSRLDEKRHASWRYAKGTADMCSPAPSCRVTAGSTCQVRATDPVSGKPIASGKSNRRGQGAGPRNGSPRWPSACARHLATSKTEMGTARQLPKR